MTLKVGSPFLFACEIERYRRAIVCHRFVFPGKWSSASQPVTREPTPADAPLLVSQEVAPEVVKIVKFRIAVLPLATEPPKSGSVDI